MKFAVVQTAIYAIVNKPAAASGSALPTEL